LLLKSLHVRNWRNFVEAGVEFRSRLSVFFGQNGQGKSNLLEAACFLVGFRSFRSMSLAEVIRWGSPAAHVDAQMVLGGLDRELAAELSLGRRRTSLDGKTVRRDSSSLQGAGIVLFTPGDLLLPKGPASERRRAVDRAVFGVCRPYFQEATDFEKALKARNGLLRRGEFGEALLDSYDETLARVGARIVERRRDVVRALAPLFAEVFAEIHGGLTASIRYRSAPTVERAAGEKEVEEALRAGLLAQRGNDVRKGFTGFGPQTDDLEMLLGEHPAKEHGSQGQLRSLVLALKIAELRQASERNREAPVLLLDDVASELDEDRRKRLFRAIAGMECQTLITVTEPGHLPELRERSDYCVLGGRIEPIDGQ
jgi:DNA replication and repair protein RecF